MAPIQHQARKCEPQAGHRHNDAHGLQRISDRKRLPKDAQRFTAEMLLGEDIQAWMVALQSRTHRFRIGSRIEYDRHPPGIVGVEPVTKLRAGKQGRTAFIAIVSEHARDAYPLGASWCGQIEHVATLFLQPLAQAVIE